MYPISIEKALPGMILAEGVRNVHGALLLSSGISLTDKHLRILKTWGAKEIFVEGEPQKTQQENIEQIEGRIKEELSLRFKDTLHHPVMQEIFACLSFTTLAND